MSTELNVPVVGTACSSQRNKLTLETLKHLKTLSISI